MQIFPSCSSCKHGAAKRAHPRADLAPRGVDGPGLPPVRENSDMGDEMRSRKLLIRGCRVVRSPQLARFQTTWTVLREKHECAERVSARKKRSAHRHWVQRTEIFYYITGFTGLTHTHTQPVSERQQKRPSVQACQQHRRIQTTTSHTVYSNHDNRQVRKYYLTGYL